MTSKPASRRARAMILAPRSWPSRPGLATRMRRGRWDSDMSRLRKTNGEGSDLLPQVWPMRQEGAPARNNPGLEPTVLAIRSEDLAQDVTDLPQGRIGLHRLDDRRHHVGALAAGPLHRPERLPHPGRAPVPLHRGEAFDLCPRHALVDLEDGDPGVVVAAGAEPVHAHD